MANVTKVEFYSGTTKLGEVAAPGPYNFTWDGATVGNKALKSIAILDDGTQVESPIVNISVNEDTGVPTYTADPLLNPYMTAVGISEDGTGYFDGTSQATTGSKWWYDIDLLIKDLKAATGVSDLSTVFGGIYPKYGGGGNLDRVKYDILNPSGIQISAPDGTGTINELGMRPNSDNNTERIYYYTANGKAVLDPDDNNDGWGVFIVIGSNEAPVGYGSTWVGVRSGDQGVSIQAEPDKTVKMRINGRELSLGIQDLRGCWAAIHNDSEEDTERAFKNGLLVNSSTEGLQLGIPETPLRESRGASALYWYSNQIHLSTLFVKVPLTDQQVADISQALLDFEARTGRKTW